MFSSEVESNHRPRDDYSNNFFKLQSPALLLSYQKQTIHGGGALCVYKQQKKQKNKKTKKQKKNKNTNHSALDTWGARHRLMLPKLATWYRTIMG